MTRRSRAQAHAKHGDFCSCGRAVFGNGARYQHAEMHKRRGDGHKPMNRVDWHKKFDPPEDYTGEPSRGRSAP